MFSLALDASTDAEDAPLPVAREVTDEGVVGRAEEDDVGARPPDQVLAGGGAAAAAIAVERRDRNGEMLERVDLDDDDIVAELSSERRPGFGG